MGSISRKTPEQLALYDIFLTTLAMTKITLTFKSTVTDSEAAFEPPWFREAISRLWKGWLEPMAVKRTGRSLSAYSGFHSKVWVPEKTVSGGGMLSISRCTRKVARAPGGTGRGHGMMGGSMRSLCGPHSSSEFPVLRSWEPNPPGLRSPLSTYCFHITKHTPSLSHRHT